MATLRDIAAHAGVSICTVSKILNRAPGWQSYTPTCVARVQRIASQLGYRRHYVGVALQTGRTDALGMVIPSLTPRDMRNGFITSLISGVEIGARAAGCHFVMIGPGTDGDILANSLRVLEEGRVDGLIVPWFACRGTLVHRLEHATKPIVIIGDAGATTQPVVTIDHAEGIRQAMHHLHQLGHRHVCWCGTRHPSAIEQQRYHAFTQAARELGMHTEALRIPIPAYYEMADVISAARRLVGARAQQTISTTATICYNEVIALGVYAGMRDIGRDIPRDMSVIGFDDIYACLASPPMTVVSHMLDELGTRAVHLLLRMRDSSTAAQRVRGQRIIVTPKLMIRASTAPPPNL
ncbi:MAG: LacI family transcriptional regulator [bacterium]|nr:LacI family transcriptional regulator [bacterium]